MSAQASRGRTAIARMRPGREVRRPTRRRWQRGSDTRRNSGIEKTSHQTATERKASRVGSVACAGVRLSPDGSPNQAGFMYHARLRASSVPPPM